MKKLYDRDFNLWVEATVTALKAKNMNAIDWDNLIEENYLIEQYSEIYRDAIASMSEQFDIPSEEKIEPDKILEDNYFG